MAIRVAVWGTGNVGRPAIRAVLSHSELELVAVIVANPEKVGVDAGTLAGTDPIGVIATADWQAVLDSQDVDALVYTATADTRGADAFIELLTALEAGINVVSTAFYPLLYPDCGMKEAVEPVKDACLKGNSSVFVSGIDPGWAMDVLPILLSGFSSDIEEVRVQEVFNYSLYDQPDVVRDVIGFGGSMASLPIMLEEFSLRMVWEPMLRVVAEALGVGLDEVEVEVQRLALEKSVEVPGMGVFEQGTQGAFRFEVRGICNGAPRLVVEHVTRIDDECAPQWPYPPQGQGCHQVLITGSPDLVVTVHGHDRVEPGPAGGGNASAASRVVNAIPSVCTASAGILSPLDLPPLSGRGQLRH
ncbi:MAG: dihydrodipicolinate reductase [Pseudomonadota bacterium]